MEENNNKNTFEEENRVTEEFTYTSDNKFNQVVAKYGGAIIGGLVALIICCTKAYKLLFYLLVIFIGVFIGNYLQKNRINVKERIKKFLNKF